MAPCIIGPISTSSSFYLSARTSPWRSAKVTLGLDTPLWTVFRPEFQSTTLSSFPVFVNFLAADKNSIFQGRKILEKINEKSNILQKIDEKSTKNQRKVAGLIEKEKFLTAFCEVTIIWPKPQFDKIDFYIILDIFILHVIKIKLIRTFFC